MMDGSLARFLVFISDNNRPDRNKDAGIFTPSADLIHALQTVACGRAGAPQGPGNLPGGMHIAPMSATASADPYTVPVTPDADAYHDRRLEDEDTWARKVQGTPQASIVNRLGENASKLALIKSISRNPVEPVITVEDMTWAWALAEHCTRSLLQDAGRFISGSEFESSVKRAFEIVRRNGPITRREMMRRHSFVLRDREWNDVLKALMDGGMVTLVEDTRTGPGRRTQRFVATSTTSTDEIGESYNDEGLSH